MPRRTPLILAILLFFVLSITSSFAWKFAALGDSRGGDTGVRAKVLGPIIDQINKENVDLVLFVGDAVNGSSDDAELGKQMDAWLALMKNLKAPWYYVPGNHEIKSATSEDVLRAKISQPMNGPEGYKGMVYSFDHKDAHFAALNSNHDGETHRVQSEWLASDLARTKQPHVFVMAHEPAYGVGGSDERGLDCLPAERDEFWKIMTDAGVSMYFCGHEHLYQRSKHGGIYQIIDGTSGASINHHAPNSIGVFHYVVIDVNGTQVHGTAKDIDGKVIDSWDYTVSPRK